jgi:uncharacterized protein
VPDSIVESKRDGNGGQLLAWIALLFVLTTVGAFPLIISNLRLDQVPQSSPLLALTGYAPTLAALLIARFYSGSRGIRTLLAQLVTWRVGVSWYLVALIGPIALILLADVIYLVLSGQSQRQWLISPSEIALTSLIGPLLAGSLGEELGWRGFAQPRLQSRCGALWAAVLIGIIWGTWHLWPVITPGGLANLTAWNLVQTYVRLISTAIIYAWMYNSTKGSLFLVMVAHAGHNIAIELIHVPADGAHTVPVITALLYLTAAIAVVLMTGPRTLSREPASC